MKALPDKLYSDTYVGAAAILAAALSPHLGISEGLAMAILGYAASYSGFRNIHRTVKDKGAKAGQ